MKAISFNYLSRMLVICTAFLSCHPKSFTISAYPHNGSPGDLVLVSLPQGHSTSKAEVTIGSEKTIIIGTKDSSISVMVPPLGPQLTKLSVKDGKHMASIDFQINQPSTVRLWFTIKNNESRFVKSQPSNESFVQNKSYSDNRLMYEISTKTGEIIVTGYINNPLEYEVPSEDRKGLSKVEQKGEVQFSINVPALRDMYKTKFFAINYSTEYKPKLLSETVITADIK
jgi:hypothetical protein